MRTTRLMLCALVSWGCSGGGGHDLDLDPPWDPGDPLPDSCAGETALEVTIGDSVLASDGFATGAHIGGRWATVITSSSASLSFQQLTIFYHARTPVRLELPDPSAELNYLRNPNGSDAGEYLYLDTDPPPGSSSDLAVAAGEMAFGQVEVAVGGRRCGWIDVTLRWTPAGEAERSLRARGTFDGLATESPSAR